MEGSYRFEDGLAMSAWFGFVCVLALLLAVFLTPSDDASATGALAIALTALCRPNFSVEKRRHCATGVALLALPLFWWSHAEVAQPIVTIWSWRHGGEMNNTLGIALMMAFPILCGTTVLFVAAWPISQRLSQATVRRGAETVFTGLLVLVVIAIGHRMARPDAASYASAARLVVEIRTDRPTAWIREGERERLEIVDGASIVRDCPPDGCRDPHLRVANGRVASGAGSGLGANIVVRRDAKHGLWFVSSGDGRVVHSFDDDGQQVAPTIRTLRLAMSPSTDAVTVGALAAGIGAFFAFRRRPRTAVAIALPGAAPLLAFYTRALFG